MDHLKRPLDQMAKRFFMIANIMRRGVDGHNTNVVVCPFSTSVVAMMLYTASHGETRKQLEAILSFKTLFDGPDQTKQILMAFREALKPCNRLSSGAKAKKDDDENNKEFQLTVATRAFVQAGADIKPGFFEEIQKYLSIDAVDLDFVGQYSGRKEMIRWLMDMAGVLDYKAIPAVLIDPFYEGSRLATLSIAHFRGAWQIPFVATATSRQLFYLAFGPPKEADLMYVTSQFPFYEDTVAGLKYIEIPYHRNTASLIVTMPTVKTLPEFMQTMTVKLLAGLRTRKRMRDVEIYLPRFSVQASYDLEKFFNLMDFANGLDAEGNANLEQMTGEKEFRVNEGLLCSAIEVSEAGSFMSNKIPSVPRKPEPAKPPLAAVKTAPVIAEMKPVKPKLKKSLSNALSHFVAKGSLSSPEEPAHEPEPTEVFRADRPFLFAVRHNKSSAILFSGCLMEPGTPTIW